MRNVLQFHPISLSHKYLTIFIFSTLCFSNTLLGQPQDQGSLIGKKVSEIHFEKILNYEKNSSKLSNYRNKLVIIDFWATWCSPCIRAFPHLDSLQKEFPDVLRVFTVTSDTEDRINKFLSKFETTLPIVIDKDYSIKKQFPHRTIPHTVVLDSDGIVRVITTAENVTRQILQKLLENQPVQVKEKKENLSFNSDNHLSRDSAIFHITLSRFQEGLPGMKSGPKNGRILMTNLALTSMYEVARRFPFSTRTLIESVNKNRYSIWSKDIAYCMEVIAPEKTDEEILQIILEYLHKNLELKSKIENRKAQVKVLKRTNDPLMLQDGTMDLNSSSFYGGEGIYAKDKPIAYLAEFLEAFLLIPVVDETNLNANYDIEIPWYEEDPGNIHNELKKLGLQLIDAEREIDLLILYDDKASINN